MKLFIKKKYYKKIKVGREPIGYKARQSKGIGTNVTATIWMDPSLKKRPRIRKAMLRHEVSEIKSWAKGRKAPHKSAVKKEPNFLRKIGGVSGYWKSWKKKKNT